MKKLLLWGVLLLMLAGATSCKENKPKSLLDQVDEVIDLFIDNYAPNYIKESSASVTIEYHVVAALATLAKSSYDIRLTDYLAKEVVEDYLINRSYSTGNDAFTGIVIAKAYDLENQQAKNFLATLEEFNPWNMSYILMALNITSQNETLKNAILGDILTVEGRDPDYAGAALMAIGNYEMDNSSLVNMIKESTTSSGVLSWGTANACTTAYGILGLVANNIDPTSEDFTVDDVNLVEALLAYHLNDGSFKYTSESEADLAYATPQSFAALVAYREFVRTNSKFGLFA